MLLRHLLFVIPLLFAATARGDGRIAYAAAVPATCDMQTGEGCRIRSNNFLKGHGLQAMFDNGMYAALEKEVTRQCQGGRLPDGQPEMLVFMAAFDGNYWSFGDRAATFKKLGEWKKAMPNSVGQPLAEALYWDTYAWQARGGGYARSVPEQAWELFHERGRKARQVLDNSKTVAAGCPLWHSMRITNLMAHGDDRMQMRAAYAEAVAQHPHAQVIHFAMANALSPQWGGSAGQFDHFAREVAKLTAEVEGMGMFARLYWSQDCNCDRAISFDDPDNLADWPTLKQGFEDLLRHYPNDLWNRNKYAALACRADDKVAYAKLRRQLGKHIYEELWHSSWTPEVCDRRLLDNA
jgi:hypothetical protein